MPGLSFLSKKSWHVKNMNNQERVWLAEQAKATEEARTKELAEQIQQEREAEELARIAGRGGGAAAAADRGIGWMYEGGTTAAAEKEAEREAEEYLLGKEYNPSTAARVGDFGASAGGSAAATAVGVESVVTAAATSAKNETESSPPAAAVSIPGQALPAGNANEMKPPSAAPAATAEPTVASRNENFHLRHEDPMYMVSQRRRDREVDAEKKKALYERVVGHGYADATDGGTAGIDGGDKKMLKGKTKTKHRKRSKGSRSRSRSRDNGRGRKRGGRKERKREKRRRDKTRSRSRSRSRSSSSRSHRRDRSLGRNRRRRSSRSESSSVGRYSSRNRRSGKYRRSRSRSYSRDRRKRSEDLSKGSRSQSRSLSQPSGNRDRLDRGESTTSSRKPASFGLQLRGVGKESSGTVGNGGPIGPDPALLSAQRKEREAARDKYHSRGNRRRRQMTSVEREEAIRSMKSDASKWEDARSRSAKEADAARRRDEECKNRYGRDPAEQGSGGNFLDELGRRAHGIDGNASMAARIERNKHTNQRPSESFL